MNRNYGILFSEFECSSWSIEERLLILEYIRRDLESRFKNPDFEFDIIKVTTHYKNNAYPEIGVHSFSGKITDSEFDELENYVCRRSRSADLKVKARKLSKVPNLSWELILKNGSYPKRN